MTPINIFLAEDNRADILLVKEALQKHQIEHELHVARDGAEAIRFMVEMGTAEGPPCPDVILLDLNLPKADGSQILSALRRDPRCIDTPVIVVSSSDSPRDREAMKHLRVRHYFTKPSDFDQFMKLGAIVKQVLESPLYTE